MPGWEGREEKSAQATAHAEALKQRQHGALQDCRSTDKCAWSSGSGEGRGGGQDEQ